MHACIHTHTDIHICAFTRILTYTYAHAYTLHTDIHIRACIHILTYTYAHAYTCNAIRMQACQ